MSTLVRKSGINSASFNRYHARAAFTLADGSACVVIHDPNSATSFDATYGDRSGTEKIYVYTSTDRVAWTLQATVTPAITGGRVTANLSPDGSVLGIVYFTGVAVRYIPISTVTWVPPTIEYGHNFNLTTEGWNGVGYNSTNARVTNPVYEGAGALAVTTVLAGNSGAYSPVGLNGHPIAAGQTVTATARYRAATTGRAASLSIFFYNSSGAQVGATVTGAAVVDVVGSYTQATVTAVAPAGAVTFAILAYWAACAAGEVHYIDDVHASIARPNGADETPRANLSGTSTEQYFDVSFTENNIPVISALRFATSGSTRCQLFAYSRRTPDNAWITSALATLETSTTPLSRYAAVSSVVLLGGVAGARNVVIAAAHGNGQHDDGIKLFTAEIDEATGLFTVVTQRATYAVGYVPGTSKVNTSRTVMLFPSDTDEYTLGFQHLEGQKYMGVARGTYDGTTWEETVPPVLSKPTTSLTQYNLAMTYSAGRLAFLSVDSSGNIVSYLASYTDETETFTFTGARWFDNKSRSPALGLASNGGAFFEYPTHDTTFIQKRANNRQEFYHIYALPAPAPALINPGAGATVYTSVPGLRSAIDLDMQYPQGLVRLRYEFATDTAFTTNYTVFEQDDNQWRLVENTHLAGAAVLVDDQLPEDQALSQQVWYVRVAVVSEYGVIGYFTPYQAFTVSHPPAAAALTPNGGFQIFDGVLEVDWNFTDPSPVDRQSAFQILAKRTDTGATFHDSGKQLTNATGYGIPVDVSTKDVLLTWAIRLWDSDDVAGDYSPDAPVYVVDRPSVIINSPASNDVLTTAIPVVQATVTVGGDRTIKKYRVRFLRGSVVAATSDWVATTLFSGQSFSYQPPVEALANLAAYSIEVMVEDSFGIQSVTNVIPVTTSWTPPAPASGVGVSVVHYNTEAEGWVELTWDDSAREVDFTRWIVYRMVVELDPLTSEVLSSTDWVQIASVNNIADTYNYRDYTAPSNYQVVYRVEQEIVRFGDTLSSNSAPAVACNPISDSYWLIDPVNFNAFRLGNVTGESLSEEYEEEEYNVIGRGRRHETGERIGYAGSLDVQIRNSGGVSARAQRKRLMDIKKENRKLYLRNPFGDLYRVAVGQMEISRIAGVGMSEFVDVTVPYSEVSDT